MIPASLGMAAIAGPLNRTFYGTANMDFSSNVLAFSSIESIPIGLFVVVAAIMQGVSQNKKAVKLFAYGTLAKFVTQYPLVYLFGAFGTLMSTMIGFFLATWLMIRALKHEFGIEKNMLQYESIQIIFYSIVMYFVALVSVYGLNWFFSLFTTPFSSIISLIVTGLASIFGAIVYAYFMLKTGLAEQVLGKRVGRLKAKFNIK